MTISLNLRREKTLPPRKSTTTFNAPGVYVPVYGKTKHLISGRGSPGNPPSGGYYAGTNPPSPGNKTGYYTAYTSHTFSGPGGGSPYTYSFTGTYAGAPYGPGSFYNSGTSGMYGQYYTYYQVYSENYNAPSPGNAYYNPGVPGNAGAPLTVLGVTFPGGAAGSPAPVVGSTYVQLSYTPGGAPVSVPPGGYINIQNV